MIEQTRWKTSIEKYEIEKSSCVNDHTLNLSDDDGRRQGSRILRNPLHFDTQRYQYNREKMGTYVRTTQEVWRLIMFRR